MADRLWALRDRLLASRRFQRWAAGNPLTRPIARRRARGLFDLCAGFVYSQVLYACVELDLFERLFEHPKTASALAEELSLTPDATARLLSAAQSLGLVARRGKDRFALGPLGVAMVGNAGIAAMVRHHAMLYRDLVDPVALLRGETDRTELNRYWAYARSGAPASIDDADAADYTQLMAASQALVAEDILDSYSLRKHRCLLDVGGGDGSFLTTAAQRAPHLRLVLFDLPAVAEAARARFARAGIADRATAVGGSFLADPLPTDADVVSLVRVIHDHDDEQALAILRAARTALPPDGTLVLAEPMAETPGAEPMGRAYFGIYLLAMGSGRPRTPDELKHLLHEAGFAQPRLLRTREPLLVRVITARCGTSPAP